jgi:hypothetical protein
MQDFFYRKFFFDQTHLLNTPSRHCYHLNLIIVSRRYNIILLINFQEKDSVDIIFTYK